MFFRRCSIFLSVVFCLVAFSSQGYAKKFDDKKFVFFQWKNPTPRFAELGFDLGEVCSIIGDSQMLIHQYPKKINLWTCSGGTGEGEVKPYESARFITSFSIIDKPRQEVADAYMNFDNYSKYMPQFTDVGIIKSEANQFLVQMKQVYKLMIFSLSADFRYLYTKESNGDLSVLLLDGDVGAGVARMEFIPVSEGKTLVVSTTWLDLASAKFVYRTIIKAQPDVKVTAPIAASAMLTEQFREMIDRKKATRPEETICLPKKPDTPIHATGNIPVETYRRLSGMGNLTFVYPKQWISTENGMKCIEYVSSAAQIPGAPEKCKPLSSDFTKFTEYFHQAKKVEIRKKDSETVIDWQLKFGLGVIGVGVDYTTMSHWINERTALFEGTKGDIHPLYGAWEWLDLQNGKTLVVFTAAVNISDNASWIVKLGNKVPNAHMIASIFMGTLIVENQAAWLEEQYEAKGDSVASSM